MILLLWQMWQGNYANGGVFLALTIFLAGISLQKIPRLKGTFYTFLVLAAVSIGMSRPEWFLEWNLAIPAWGIQIERLKCTDAIIPLLQMIMFGMGTQLTAGDFRQIAIQPKGVLIGMFLQFSIMPMSGFLLASSCALLPEEYGLSPEILAGIVLIGCSRSGIASNVMAFLAKANVALSVTLTSCATLTAPIVTPFLLKNLAGQYIEMNFLQMTSDITHLIIFPIIAGLLFRVLLTHGWNFRRELPHILFYMVVLLVIPLLFTLAGLYPLSEGLSRTGILVGYCVGGAFLAGQILHPIFTRWPPLQRIISTFSALAVCAVVLFTVVVGRDALLKVGGILMVVCLFHNRLGYFLGYYFAQLAGMEERDRRTLAIEVGMQNGGLATSIAVGLGKVATLGLAPTIFGCFMNITGSLLSARWSQIPTPQKSTTEKIFKPSINKEFLMKSAQYLRAGEIESREIPNSHPGEGEVKIKVAWCGICGTDLHIFQGDLDRRLSPPQSIGHEMSGWIAEIGSGVTGWNVGDAVTVRPLENCGKCHTCRAGWTHICEHLHFLGIETPGAFAEFWTVPARLLHRLPTGMAMDLAALVEPLAVACHDVRRAEIQKNDFVVVFGAGPIGILIALTARKAGGNVTVAEIQPARRKFAQKLGFSVLNPLEEDAVVAVQEATGDAEQMFF